MLAFLREVVERHPWLKNRNRMTLTALCCTTLLAATYAVLESTVTVTVRSSPVPPGAHATSSVIRKLAASHAPHVLNVHVVPHTHDDVGWRKTVAQYYYGWNNTLDERGAVREIWSTVVEALTEHEARTFVYAETKFFSMWWQELQESGQDSVKDTVRYLIANQQLSFVNGGWCMHDEATAHFVGMVDQTTTGHQFLLRELGVVPRTGWQLDPFGHSATQASLLTWATGMDALYFGRIDDQDLTLRQATAECEGLWDATADHDDDATIFWGLTGSYGGNYGPPQGFMFDTLFDDERLVGLNETRLHERVLNFLQQLATQSSRTKGNHILLTMGTDFTFREAHVGFSNYDLLIGTIMNYQTFHKVNITEIFGPGINRVNIFYSNPDYYTQQKYEEMTRTRQQKPTSTTRALVVDPDKSDGGTVHETMAPVNWTVKTDDFFPYSDGPNSFWTGYFTSRAGLKRFERVASSFLLAARQIDALPEPSSKTASTTDGSDHHAAPGNDGLGSRAEDSPLFALEDAVGVVQHHDGVSGTAKQHVADDYSRQLAVGLNRASEHVAQKLRRVMLAAASTALSQTKDPQQLSNLSYCPLLNETICPISEDATTGDDNVVYVIVYNPLAANRSSVVRLPVASDDSFRIERIEEDEHKTICVIRATPVRSVQANSASIKYVLTFDTGNLPPVGAVAFRIVKEPHLVPGLKEQLPKFAVTQETTRLSNSVVSAIFDTSTGMLKGLESSDGASLSIEQSWGYYKSFDSTIDDHSPVANTQDAGSARTSSQNSGAYIFRPSIPNERMQLLKPKANAAVFVNTSVGYEVHAFFHAPWIQQVTRVTKGLAYIEVEYTVGPIPILDGRGKEIVSRLSAPAIQSMGRFYTDSNGRQFQERQRNYRPTWNLTLHEPVAGNYYPVNAAIFIEDANASLTVLVDRSQGGSSLFDGSIELMVQRRTLADDARGVDEPLNETLGGMTPYPPYGRNERIGEGAVYRGKHRILFGKGSVGASLARSEMDRVFAEPLVFVGSWSASDPVIFNKASFSGLQASLPDNVMLVTLMRLPGRNKTTFLLRLGHQYAPGEDGSLSNPVSVDICSLLSGYNITSFIEKTLSGNQNLTRWLTHRLDWTGKTSSTRSITNFSSSNITLAPMQIRTFELVTDSPAG